MTTLTLSIGRNIGDVPMSDEDWATFRADVPKIVGYIGRVVFTGDGRGAMDDTGRLEESFTVIVANVGDEHTRPRIVKDGGLERIDGRTLSAALYNELAGLAHSYKQECIAATLGTTEFPGS